MFFALTVLPVVAMACVFGTVRLPNVLRLRVVVVKWLALTFFSVYVFTPVIRLLAT